MPLVISWRTRSNLLLVFDNSALTSSSLVLVSIKSFLLAVKFKFAYCVSRIIEWCFKDFEYIPSNFAAKSILVLVTSIRTPSSLA